MKPDESLGPRDKDYLRCPAVSYPIRRDVCRSRQAEGGHRECNRCPERGRQLSLFDSPLQIDAPVASRRRRKRPRTGAG